MLEKIKCEIESVKNIHPSKIPYIYEKFKNYNGRTRRVDINQEVKHILGIDKSYPPTSINYWLKRGWSLEEAKLKKPKKKNYQSPFKISYWRNKINPNTNEIYTDDEIKQQIRSYRKNNKEYWIKKGYSETEANLKVKEIQSKNGKQQDYSKDLKKDRTHNQINYWINKHNYTLEEAKLKIKEIQDNLSLKFHVSKQGLNEGIISYIKQCKNLAFKEFLMEFNESHNISDENEFIKELYIAWKKYRKSFYHASKESLILFKPLMGFCDKYNLSYNIGYNGFQELKLYYTEKRFYRYDFCINDFKLIFEYDGYFYHQDKEKDKLKDKLAISNGYKVIRIKSEWSHEEKVDIITKEVYNYLCIEKYDSFIKERYFLNGNRRKNERTKKE